MKAGKCLQPVQRIDRIKGLGVHLDGRVGGVAACTATGMLFQGRRMGGAVGAQKELRSPLRGRLQQSQSMLFALEHGQAVIVRTHPTQKQRIAIEQQMVCGDGGTRVSVR